MKIRTIREIHDALDRKEVVLPHMLPALTLGIIGPCFAAQFNLVMTKAIDQGDVAVV